MTEAGRTFWVLRRSRKDGKSGNAELSLSSANLQDSKPRTGFVVMCSNHCLSDTFFLVGHFYHRPNLKIILLRMFSNSEEVGVCL